MKNKVFLWEMDSVRNSERECQLAREALYRALLVDGNVVVMTFNQLADARRMQTMESKVENVNQRSSWYGQVDQQRETDPSIDKILCDFQKLLADV